MGNEQFTGVRARTRESAAREASRMARAHGRRDICPHVIPPVPTVHVHDAKDHAVFMEQHFYHTAVIGRQAAHNSRMHSTTTEVLFN